jgi:hypothetical protein
MKVKIFMLGMALSLIALSCSKKEEATSSSFTAEEATINAKLDITNDDVANVVEEQVELTLASSTGKFTEKAPLTCPTVTRVPAFGTVITSGTSVTKTIDFGTGCVLPNGNSLKGIITISFVYNPNATSNTVAYSFTNFYHNLRKIEGTKTFTRTMTVATANSPSHPIVVMNVDLSMTLPDGRVYSRVGTRTREITAGYNTPDSWTDNEYRVTGNWTTTSGTTVQTSAIITPLLIKLACIPTNSPISQGTIAFNRNGNSATLDYGNGVCDNLAVFNYNGTAYNIVLGN